MKYLFSIILGFLCVISYGQNKEFSKAILIDEEGIKDKIFRSYYDQSIEKLISLSGGNLLLYDWNAKNHTVKFADKNKFEEKPSDIVIFLKPYGRFELNPAFDITTDTTGKTTSAQFILESEMAYACKHIDPITSTILKNETIVLQRNQKEAFKVDNVDKEFGGDPAKLKKSNYRKYEEMLEKLREKYKEKIEEKYKSAFFLQMASSRLAKNILAGSQDYFKVIPPGGTAEKKVKSIKFQAGVKDNLVKKDNYKVVAKRMIGTYHFYEDLATVYIDEIGETESTASTFLFASKDLGAALTNKEELLMVKEDNTFMMNQLNIKPGEKKVNLAIKKNCMFCDEELEIKLYECPVITLIERNAPELKYFNNLTKDERFIDFSVEDLQGKQIGYQLLLTQNDKYYQIIETATNKNIASFEKKYQAVETTSRMDVFAPKKVVLDIGMGDIQRFLSAYNPEIYKVEWISTLEEKKEKIEKIAAYHAAGMDRYMEYDFYTLESEEVDGEQISRKNKIGRGKIGKSISPNISELKIKDGEKEIYKAAKNGVKILIEVSDKTR